MHENLRTSKDIDPDYFAMAMDERPLLTQIKDLILKNYIKIKVIAWGLPLED
jgi:hypothetical protein